MLQYRKFKFSGLYAFSMLQHRFSYQATLRDCSDLRRHSPSTRSGVYNLYSDKQYQAYHAYCDMENNGGGWTVRTHIFHFYFKPHLVYATTDIILFTSFSFTLS